MVTIVDVSRRAGVSTATVSRVLNKPEVVDQATRNAVEQAIKSLNYRPNVIARGLASRSSRTMGVVINCFGSGYYGRMLDGVEMALENLGYKTIAESSRETSEGERETWLSLLDRQCEGVVVHSDNLSDQELAVLLGRHEASVLMNRLLKGFEDRCVYLDNVVGGRLAMRYLLDQGHRDIAMVSGPSTFYEVTDRQTGAKEAMADAGLCLDPDLCIEGDFSTEGGRAALEQLWAAGKSFTAVFFHNDEMAAGGLEACIGRGIAVPNDLSVIGFDDVDVARYLTPKLTTVRQPLDLIGGAAGELIHAIVTGADQAEISKSFVPEVIERDSVRVIQTNHA